MKVAIVGRRNVGKSTFVNTLAESDRLIVSEVPGTTRDSVDVHFEMDGQTFHRDRHAWFEKTQEPANRFGVLRHAPGSAKHSTCRRGFDVL